MKKGTEEYSDDALRDMAVVDAVRRGRLTSEVIAFTFSLSLDDIARILKEASLDK